MDRKDCPLTDILEPDSRLAYAIQMIVPRCIIPEIALTCRCSSDGECFR